MRAIICRSQMYTVNMHLSTTYSGNFFALFVQKFKNKRLSLCIIL